MPTQAPETAADRLRSLQSRQLELESRFRETRDARRRMQEEAAAQLVEGISPNGTRARLSEMDSEIDVISGALSQIAERIRDTETEAAREDLAGRRVRLDEVQARALAVAEEVRNECSAVLPKIDELRELEQTYASLRSQISNITQSRLGESARLPGFTLGSLNERIWEKVISELPAQLAGRL